MIRVVSSLGRDSLPEDEETGDLLMGREVVGAGFVVQRVKQLNRERTMRSTIDLIRSMVDEDSVCEEDEFVAADLSIRVVYAELVREARRSDM